MHSSKPNPQARLGPLHYAVLKRDLDDVRNQLQQGVDVIAQNLDGDTALHMLRHPRKRTSARDAALTADEWDYECIRLAEEIVRLLSSADKRCFRAVDAVGNTPLMSCLNAPDIKIYVVAVLLELDQQINVNGIDFDILNNENESALDLAFVSGRPDYVDVICEYYFRNSPTVSVTISTYCCHHAIRYTFI